MDDIGISTARTGIRLSGLTKSYGQVRAVRGIDVTADGRFVILTTANDLGFSVWQLDLDLDLEELRRQIAAALDGFSGDELSRLKAVVPLLERLAEKL